MPLAGSGKHPGFLTQKLRILVAKQEKLRTWSNKIRVVGIIRETDIFPRGKDEREGTMCRSTGRGGDANWNWGGGEKWSWGWDRG